VAGIQLQVSGPVQDAVHETWIRSEYALRARFGTRATVPIPGWWHGTEQVVYVFERSAR
jgi:hypothetical protein